VQGSVGRENNAEQRSGTAFINLDQAAPEAFGLLREKNVETLGVRLVVKSHDTRKGNLPGRGSQERKWGLEYMQKNQQQKEIRRIEKSPPDLDPRVTRCGSKKTVTLAEIRDRHHLMKVNPVKEECQKGHKVTKCPPGHRLWNPGSSPPLWSARDEKQV